MNIECMCRVCETVQGLKNIFDEENEELLLMLRSVANISITADDYLPKYICNLCARRLRLSYDFKVQCEMIDQTLREMLAYAPLVSKNLKESSPAENDPEDSWKPIYKTNLKIEPANEYIFSSFASFEEAITNEKIETEEHLEDEESQEIEEAANSEAFSSADVDKLEEFLNEEADCDIVKNIEEVSSEKNIPLANVFQEKENEESLPVSENSLNFIEQINDAIATNTQQMSNTQNQENDTPQEIFQFVINKSGEIEEGSFPLEVTAVNPNDTQVVLTLENIFSNTRRLTNKFQHAEPTPVDPNKKKYTRRKVSKTFSCNVCSATFTEYAELNAHKRSHGRLRFQCHLCDKRFARRNGLEDHLATHDGKKVPCHLCDKQCSNRGNLFRHIRQCHNKIKPYACEICEARFARRSSLKAHASCHTEKREHDCEICGKKFKTIFYLKTHMRLHLPPGERMQRVATQKKRKEQVCICPHCGKRSTQLSTHITHMKIHSDVKPHVCKICGKNFHFKQSLTTHMLCHTGEKPFRCELCGKEFRQIAHLSTHKLSIHSQERPHKCRYCQKAFVGAGTLKIHERIHTGEKPYECKSCPSKFIDSNGLKKHVMRVHSNVEDQPKDIDSNDASQDQLNKYGEYDQRAFVQNEDSQIDGLSINPAQLNCQQEIAIDQLNVYIDELQHGYTEVIQTES